ncbi:hypothetical protein, partial [Streptococcus pneumoniae]
MSLSDLMAQAEEAAAETATTVAWLNIAADALASAQMDPMLPSDMGEQLLRAEVSARLAVYVLKEG